MESLNTDVVLLQCIRSVPSDSFNTAVSSNSEQEQHPPETNQETPELTAKPPELDLIQFRMQQLHNRRFVLLKIQNCIKKEEGDSNGTAEETTKEDGEEHSELKAIQRELEELEVKKKELENNGGGSKPRANTGQQNKPPSYKESPRGGIYMLPPLQPAQIGGVISTTVETQSQVILPVENLGQTGGVTKCPSCEAVVITETHSSVGEAVWIACFVSFMLGCVAGCCLIPFFLKRFKNIHHSCPACQAHIYTNRPF